MTILVDPPSWPAHGRRWSHLVSDADFAELHLFARGLGVPERGFEGDHYDLPEERYADAVRAGAVPVSGRELLRRLQDSGLRRPKRRGERVLSSVHAPDGPGRVDTVLSAREPAGRVLAVIVVVRHEQTVLVLPDDAAGVVLPRTVLASGHSASAAAAALVERVLGRSGSASPGGSLTQLGYLRRVGGAARTVAPASESELVLEWTGSATEPRRAPLAPARWLSLEVAGRLLPADVAPLLPGPEPTSHRPT